MHVILLPLENEYISIAFARLDKFQFSSFLRSAGGSGGYQAGSSSYGHGSGSRSMCHGSGSAERELRL